MLHQTPIPQPSETYGSNQGQLLHVILQQRQIDQQQRYYTPKREPHTISPTVSTTTQNSPQTFRVGVAQQINQQQMDNHYNQIMQYYKELDFALQQQKQESGQKYNEILYKIDNIQQMMVQNINQLNINQRNEYQQLLSELQQQRIENEKRYQVIFQNMEAQNQQQKYIVQLQEKEILLKQELEQIQKQKVQQLEQYSPYSKPPLPLPKTPSKYQSLEDQLFPEKQQNYSSIHRQKNSQPQSNQSYQTPHLENSQNQNSLLNVPVTNQPVHRTKSPREQQSPRVCAVASPNSSQSHKKKQIFDKPLFDQVNHKPIFNYPIRNPHTQLQQTPIPFQADESVLIDEPPQNQGELLQHLKAEYGITSLSQMTTLQYNVNQLQLIYCLFCDQYISLPLADSHLQGCSQTRPMRRQNDNYLDIYINHKSNDLFLEMNDSKRICIEISKIKQLMQLACSQKWATYEHMQLRDFCQIAILIMEQLLKNPNSYQLQKYHDHIQQIFNVVYAATQIFYKQQAQLLQKCLSRIRELQQLYKK